MECPFLLDHYTIYCSFLLLVQKKRTKRKRHPAAWPSATLAKLRAGALPETRFAQTVRQLLPRPCNFASAALHGIKDRSRTTMKTGWWRYGMGKLPLVL